MNETTRTKTVQARSVYSTKLLPGESHQEARDRHRELHDALQDKLHQLHGQFRRMDNGIGGFLARRSMLREMKRLANMRDRHADAVIHHHQIMNGEVPSRRGSLEGDYVRDDGSLRDTLPSRRTTPRPAVNHEDAETPHQTPRSSPVHEDVNEPGARRVNEDHAKPEAIRTVHQIMDEDQVPYNEAIRRQNSAILNRARPITPGEPRREHPQRTSVTPVNPASETRVMNRGPEPRVRMEPHLDAPKRSFTDHPLTRQIAENGELSTWPSGHLAKTVMSHINDNPNRSDWHPAIHRYLNESIPPNMNEKEAIKHHQMMAQTHRNQAKKMRSFAAFPNLKPETREAALKKTAIHEKLMNHHVNMANKLGG